MSYKGQILTFKIFFQKIHSYEVICALAFATYFVDVLKKIKLHFMEWSAPSIFHRSPKSQS